MTSVRRGQLVAPFGVGAVVDIGSESYTCVDISRWNSEETVGLAESTLSQRLRRQVRTPTGSAPFYRFPRWHFCPRAECRRMSRIDDQWEEAHQAGNSGRPPRCAACGKAELTPMGFVQACQNGHLDEVDWYRWAHRNRHAAATASCAPGTARMKFVATGAAGGDWSSLSVACECGAREDFEGLTTRPLPWNCTGRQPWQATGAACVEHPTVLRRGSSNLYYPNTLSAIDVEASAGGTAGAAAVRNAVKGALDSNGWPTTGMLQVMLGAVRMNGVLALLENHLQDLAHSLDVPLHDVQAALAAELQGEAPAAAVEPGDGPAFRQSEILKGEWSVLSRGAELRTDKLIVLPRMPAAGWTGVLAPLIRRISLVPRLREVRALVGFRRIGDVGSTETPVDLSGTRNWLPGVEVWGEGIFIEFSEAAIAEWEARVTTLTAGRVQELQEAIGGWRDPADASARFIALHSLSHLIMRRMAFDAGYSSSSLRERIYAAGGATPMAGILIYTADADSEGSLGGLVQMGEPALLGPLLDAALADGGWCSADPVCAETERQGPRGMNGAACHACALVAETCCTHGNQLLDRRFLLDLGEAPLDFGLVRIP